MFYQHVELPYEAAAQKSNDYALTISDLQASTSKLTVRIDYKQLSTKKLIDPPLPKVMIEAYGKVPEASLEAAMNAKRALMAAEAVNTEQKNEVNKSCQFYHANGKFIPVDS